MLLLIVLLEITSSLFPGVVYAVIVFSLYISTRHIHNEILHIFSSMMSNQGLTSLFPMEDISVMGVLELLPHLKNFTVSSIQCMILCLLKDIGQPLNI